MSRIQDILSKAEREGTVRHTHTPDASQPPHPEAPPSGAAAPPRRRIERAPLREARPLPEDLREVAPGAYDSLLVAALAPHSLAAEQYRTLRTRIVMLEEGRARRVLLMTSPAKGDGKSYPCMLLTGS